MNKLKASDGLKHHCERTQIYLIVLDVQKSDWCCLSYYLSNFIQINHTCIEPFEQNRATPLVLYFTFTFIHLAHIIHIAFKVNIYIY